MKRLVQVKDCDRCPVNKRRPATHKDVVFGFGDTKWKIDLCDQHYEMLSRDMYAWGLMGEAVEDTRQRTFMSSAEMRRLAELRELQAREDREIATAGSEYAVVTSGSKLVERLGRIDVPTGGEDWFFTKHALDRMDERGMDPIDILSTVSSPAVIHDAREPGLKAYERDDTRVIVNPSTKTIITVAWRDRAPTGKAVGL